MDTMTETWSVSYPKDYRDPEVNGNCISFHCLKVKIIGRVEQLKRPPAPAAAAETRGSCRGLRQVWAMQGACGEPIDN